MKTSLKPILTALSLALVAATTLSSCKTTGDSRPSGAHTMGSSQSGYKMADRDMPGR